MPKEVLPLFAHMEAEAVENQLRDHAHRFDYNTRDWTIEVLLKKLNEKDIIVPEYQRQFVWTPENQSRFIESVFLEIPVPNLFLAELETTGQLEIVDGVQRINTLRDFVDGKLHIGELDILTALSGFRFSNLAAARQRKFINRSLRAVVIGEAATPGAKFDIFARLNTKTSPLTPAEIRRGAFRGKFQDLIAECAAMPKFLDQCGMADNESRTRREPEELVLRFFCYAERHTEFRHDVAYFLDDYLESKNKTASDQDIELWRNYFHRMVDFVSENLPFGFTKSAQSKQTPRVRFEAISVGTHLALNERADLSPVPTKWLNSEEFKKHVRTDASNSLRRLTDRVEFVRNCLLGEIAENLLSFASNEEQ